MKRGNKGKQKWGLEGAGEGGGCKWFEVKTT